MNTDLQEILTKLDRCQSFIFWLQYIVKVSEACHREFEKKDSNEKYSKKDDALFMLELIFFINLVRLDDSWDSPIALQQIDGA